ncbi:MAG: hypothetical protein IVW55_08080 [Chloroflexi bacterium]|nr:hypothetical protein [Chloroflexota bacterium]
MKERLGGRWVFFAVFVAGGLALVVGLVAAAYPCDIVNGSCRYDPRSQRPSPLFIAQAPEPFVVQYLNGQIKQNGTYPPGATSRVASFTPVLVRAGGFYSDWHVPAQVVVRIGYVDKSEQEVVFELFERRTWQIFGLENTQMGVEYGAVTECGHTLSRSVWNCW